MSQNDFTSVFSIVLTLDFEIVVAQNGTSGGYFFVKVKLYCPILPVIS